MSTITCLAAVAWEAKKPMVVQEIEVAPPKRGEVRVKILATAVCHTDVYTWNGLDPEGAFPVIFGHEGCGAVESVGEGVTSVAPGDIVIPLFTAECGKCDYCLSGKSNLCGAIRDYSSKGVMSDGTVRFTSKGKPIYHYMGTSTFTEYTVIHEISCCKITSSVPFDKLCLFGCGIPTGVGAVLNTSKVEPGSTVAVFGCGAIGLSAIQGAKMAGASQIIAVDINPEKFEISKSFGATSCVNPDDHKQSISDVLVEMTGGLDYTFECTGKTEVMNSALAAAHKGWGDCCIIGIAALSEEIHVRPFLLVTGRVWRGSAFGGYKGRTQLPGLVDKYVDGTLKVDEMITGHYKLQDINKTFDALLGGHAIRSVMVLADKLQ